MNHGVQHRWDIVGVEVLPFSLAMHWALQEQVAERLREAVASSLSLQA